jgi:hypothetical protein
MRNSYLQAFAIQDVLQQFNWTITIPRIPGAGDTRALSAKCISTDIPGSKIEQTKLTAQGGIELNFAGRRTWDQTWTTTFIEDRSADTRSTFLNWLDLIRNPVLGLGTYKVIYAVPVELALYDDVGLQIRSIKLVNAFPIDVGNGTLDGSNGIVQYSIQWSYDLVEEV